MTIFATTTHAPSPTITNACDYYRTIQPMQELAKHLDWQIDLKRSFLPDNLMDDIMGKEAQREWIRIGRTYDLVWYSYLHAAITYSLVRVITEKYGHTMSMDYDDNLLKQDLLNPTVVIEKMKNPVEDDRIEKILADLPHSTVTNQYLKDEYTAFARTHGHEPDIHVLPNCIDLTLYDAPRRPKRHHEVVIGFFGSTSHQADLYHRPFHQALMQVRKAYPHVRFEIVGNFIPDYLNGMNARITAGHIDFYRWVEVWKRTVATWDIGVAPLRDTPFNKSRSQIKWMEYAAAGVPLVASDIGLYTSPTVRLAKTRQQWFDHLATLIESREAREQEGKAAYNDAAAHHTIQGNWWRWRDAIEAIVG